MECAESRGVPRIYFRVGRKNSLGRSEKKYRGGRIAQGGRKILKMYWAYAHYARRLHTPQAECLSSFMYIVYCIDCDVDASYE